jgi:hypothetical protein
MPAIGVLGETLASEAEGELIILGEIKGVDTSAFNEGDEVYVADGGGYTNIAPTDPDVEVQFLGIVTRVDNTNGAGYILGTAVEDKIRYNSTSSIFEGWDGTAWEPLGTSSVTISNTTPSSPNEGDLWYDSDIGNLFIWYVDIDGAQWVDVGTTGSQGAQGPQGESGSPPSDLQVVYLSQVFN